MTFLLSYSSRQFSFPQGYRKDNWLKVQLIQGTVQGNGSIEGNEIHKSRTVQVESSGASSNQEVKCAGRTVLCSVGAGKMQERCYAVKNRKC